jgi:hypothetical protein
MTARYTVFEGEGFLVNGPKSTIIQAIRARQEAGDADAMLIFDDATGQQTDVDLRESADSAEEKASGRGKGRPRLGVVSREVTLLPRHWEWLRAQPGGASVTLRRLVDDARRSNREGSSVKRAQNAAYAFMSAMAGNLPGFEEAIRALFAGEQTRFEQVLADWPADIGRYARDLAEPSFREPAHSLQKRRR